ncbi:hypothetical protein GBA52_021907 [Prunus armeniaca]|nr:hypothetical protein GBA52_021907 [Prunus armeniaca]
MGLGFSLEFKPVPLESRVSVVIDPIKGARKLFPSYNSTRKPNLMLLVASVLDSSSSPNLVILLLFRFIFRVQRGRCDVG